MGLIIAVVCLVGVIAIYFGHNPMFHSGPFLRRRFVNWFPLGMTYAFLYMARYNLNVCKNELGAAMSKEDFGLIFGIGTFVYGLSILMNGPLVDKMGGKKGIAIGALGAAGANIALGVITYLHLQQKLNVNLTLAFALLYSLNMFFQSYGAVSVIKVKAYWFHVRERGLFGAIFGTLISFGSYFAFDWGAAIIDYGKAHPVDNLPATWLVFFVPATFLLIWFVLDLFLIRDYPSQAGFKDFDTADASSGEMEKEFTIAALLHRIVTSKLMLTFAVIEFTAGVIRNGVMQWYFIFAHELPQGSSEFFLKNWGLLICLVGIIGGFSGGYVSDLMFQSRRGPPAAIAQGLICLAAIIMSVFLFNSPTTIGICCLIMFGAVITVHSLLSGTAAADFGGRKATATASGILDGFTYLGSGVQSVCLGYLTSKSWHAWPLFLIPFAILGLWLSIRCWRDLPEATKRYLESQAAAIPSPVPNT